MSSNISPSQPARRGFFKQCAASVIGGVLALVPAAAGIAVLFDPLRRRTKAGSDAGFVRVASLAAVPPDGAPRQFPVMTSRRDAWTTHPNTPVGSVFLRRTEGDEVHALNAVCPHLGCNVSFRHGAGAFLCPCHDSSFTLDGAVKNPSSPSPRGLDALAVEIREGSEIWVRFQNFQAGTAEKIPVS